MTKLIKAQSNSESIRKLIKEKEDTIDQPRSIQIWVKNLSPTSGCLCCSVHCFPPSSIKPCATISKSSMCTASFPNSLIPMVAAFNLLFLQIPLYAFLFCRNPLISSACHSSLFLCYYYLAPTAIL